MFSSNRCSRIKKSSLYEIRKKIDAEVKLKTRLVMKPLEEIIGDNVRKTFFEKA